jgi:antitoxin component of MazEF toxin-antitoxin module
MRVSRWGNSLAVRLPSAVVEALGLKEGELIEIRIVEACSGARAQAARSFACGACL